MNRLAAISLIFGLFTAAMSHAQESSIEDAYNPFADYSDFVEAATEETDINFFKFGRMLSIGFTAGQQGFTNKMNKIYSPSLSFGGFLNYHMSIPFAIQLNFSTSTHDTSWSVPAVNETFSGQARFNSFGLYGKYFLNTQNLTRAIAKYNPYFIAGVSQMTREVKSPSQISIIAKDPALSIDFGGGIEYMFNSNKHFFSLQFLYQKVDFQDENTEITIKGSNDEVINTGLKAKGDLFKIMMSIGFNF